MIRELRARFNEQFTPERYAALLRQCATRCGTTEIAFRIAESPLFLTRDLVSKAAEAATEILLRAASPELQANADAQIPKDERYAGDSQYPLFSAVDLAIAGTPEAPELKLIELQGFPSLFHWQELLGSAMADVYQLGDGLTGFADPGLDSSKYHELLRSAIIGDHDPSEVVLVELDPLEQKTLPDLLLASRMLGINIVNLRSIEADGTQLCYRDTSGSRRPIRRIFNRSILGEAIEKGVRLRFEIDRDYDVTWAGHPNWFYKISKSLLPQLVGLSSAVPDALLLSDPRARNVDLANCILKPLYAFAGAGVQLHPTQATIDSIPVEMRDQWLLQERVLYADAFRAPTGEAVRAELRIMFVWPENAPRPIAAHTLVRTTLGEKIGAQSTSAQMRWSGSSAALIQAG